MDIQQIIALLIVAVAAVYLGRNAVRTFQAFRSNKSGCASGCGKCAYAKDALPGRPAAAPKRPDIIPLTEIKSLPHKRS